MLLSSYYHRVQPPQLAVLYQAIRPIMILVTFAKDHSVEQSSHLFALMYDFMCLSISLMPLWKGIGDLTGNLSSVGTTGPTACHFHQELREYHK